MKKNIFLLFSGILVVCIIMSIFVLFPYNIMRYRDYKLNAPSVAVALKWLDSKMLTESLAKGSNPDQMIEYNLRKTFPLIYVHYGWYLTHPRGKTLDSLKIEEINHEILALTKILVNNGADINVYDGEATPLLASVREHNYSVAAFLLSKGAKYKDNEFELLWMGATDNDYVFLNQLIEAGANVNVVNSKGNTILHELILNNYSARIIREVTNNLQIDINVRNADNLSVSDIADRLEKTDVAAVIGEYKGGK